MHWSDQLAESTRSATLPWRGGSTDVERCRRCPVRAFAICSALPLEGLHRVSAFRTVRTAHPHEIIFLEGDIAEHVFLLNEGVVKLYKQLRDGRQQVTGFLFGGDVAGLSINGRYMATAEAVTRTGVCRVPRRRVRELMAMFPELERRLLAIVSHELAAAQDQLLLLGRRNALERLACFLLLLSHRAAEHGQPPNPVFLPMTRADIADYLGLSIETVSRSFTRLARDGVVRLIEPHLAEVVQRQALVCLSEGGTAH